MRQDKHIAFELRKKGKSYREISQELGVSKSTLCAWFKDIEWSKHIRSVNNRQVYLLSKERIEKLNQVRREKLDVYYKEAEQQAIEEFKVFKNEPLFMAGLMAYAGEGDKMNKNHIRISNSEFYINKFFVEFSVKYLDFKRENMKCGLIVYPDHDINQCINIWSIQLGIPEINFHKTQVIKGKERVKRLQFGVGMVIISNTFLKKKLMKWLDLCKIEF